jgi:hypothetical protein
MDLHDQSRRRAKHFGSGTLFSERMMTGVEGPSTKFEIYIKPKISGSVTKIA